TGTVPAAPGPPAAGTVHYVDDEPRWKVPDTAPECGARLTLAGVEDLARVEGAAHRVLHGERARLELAAHAVPFQDADAVLPGHRAAQRDGRVEEFLERRLGGFPGGRVARGRDQARVQ